MKLTCIKSKTTLFTPGNKYEVKNVIADYDRIKDILYSVITELGSSCFVPLSSGQVEFKIED